jgi:hypothetical protein
VPPDCDLIFQISHGITETIFGIVCISFSLVRSVFISKVLFQTRLIIKTDLDKSILELRISSETLRIGTNLSTESIPICEELSHFFMAQILFFISVPITVNSHQPRNLAFSTREIGNALSINRVFTGTKIISSLSIYFLEIFSPELIITLSDIVVLPLAVKISE